jgi:predicted outer membrane repeat protein
MSISNFGSVDAGTCIGGGAVVLKNVASALFHDVIFENNFAQMGGAVSVDESRSVVFLATSFVGNMAHAAGAVYVNSGNDQVHFLNCRFVNNTATRGGGDDNNLGDGGGVLINSNNGLVQFSMCVFSENNAVSGGAVYAIRNNPQIEFSDCQFLNQSANTGGAIYLYTENENLQIKNCLFSNNFADLGAVFYAHSSNSTFERNKAVAGSCVYLNSNNNRASFTEVSFLWNIAEIYGTVALNSDNNYAFFFRCEFSSNQVGAYGAALSSDSNNKLLISQCTFTANRANSGILYFNSKNRECTLQSSTFFGNIVEREGGCVALTSHNHDFHVDNCFFGDNSAGVAGGAIHSAILNDNMRITNSHISNCTAGSLGSALYFGSDHKNIFVSNCSFSANHAGTGTIYVSQFNNNFTLSSSVLRNNVATAHIGGIVSLADTSFITSSHFSANSEGAIHVEAGQSARVQDCYISHTQGTGQFIKNSVFVLVASSTFMNNIGKENGGALSISSSERVSVIDSIFERNQCLAAGAAIHISSSNQIDINQCAFTGNSASSAGGAIYAAESATFINASTFIENQGGTFGSAIFATAVPSMNITNNVFTRNRAGLAGTVHWQFSSGMVEPVGLRPPRNSFAPDNDAAYGEQWATEGTALVMGNSGQTPYEVTQYQHAVPSFSVELHDFYSQTVLVESSQVVSIAVLSVLAAECFDSVGYLAGSGREPLVNGTAVFSSLVAYCAPRHTLSLEAQSTGVSSVSFQLHFRDCLMGEYYGESECFACESGSYSLLDPAGASLDQLTQVSVCQSCHSSSEDCYGNQIVLKKGYWRRFDSSAHIMECPLNKHSCVGGNSTTSRWT